ncbi:hypothetical protein BC936DRAFT_149297, partial [Jimgerdemannia flammicorona]
GQIFCARCASNTIPTGEKFKNDGRVRVCNYCFRAKQEWEEQELEEAALDTDFNTTNPGTPVQNSSFLTAKVQIPTKNAYDSTAAGGSYASSYEIPAPLRESLLARCDDFTGPPSPADSIHTLDWSRRGPPTNPLFRPPRSRSNTFSSGLDDFRFGGGSPSLGPGNGFPLAGSSPVPFRRTPNISPGMPIVDGVPGGLIPADPEFGPFMSDEEEGFDMWNPNPTHLLSFLSGTFGGLTGATGHAHTSSVASVVDASTDTNATNTPAPSDYGGSEDESYDYKGRPRSGYQRAEDLRTMFAKDRSASRRRTSLTGIGPRPIRTASRSLLRHTGSVADSISEGYVPASPLLDVGNFGFGVGSRDQDPLCTRPESPVLTRHRRSLSGPLNVELNESSLEHLRKLLRQMLEEANLADERDGWEDVLLNLLLKVSDNVHPDIQHGDEIDIRHYVKIKRIPGGEPRDSHYVRGVVCTKNVAHKHMASTVTNPRVLILLFALEYARVENQMVSFDSMSKQERQHLQNLVNRIVAFNPSIVILKSSVPRLALEFLLKANVTVVYNVKPSVIEAVARCTRAVIIHSYDQLSAGESHLGKCGMFTTKTYVHEWIPNRRKTFLVFDDCSPELGCTIVLRGGTEATLTEVKRIMDFMVFVVNNLRLESFLMRDQSAMPGLNLGPIEDHGAGKEAGLADEKEAQEAAAAAEARNALVAVTGREDISELAVDRDAGAKEAASYFGLAPESLVAEDERVKSITLALKTYETLILSASSWVRFEPPYLLLRMKEEEIKLACLRLRRSLIERNWMTGTSKEFASSPVATSPGGMSEKSRPLSSASSMNSISGLRSIDQSIFEDGEYEHRKAEHDSQLRAWEMYLLETSHQGVSPYLQQNIVVLYSNINTVTTMPCQGPDLRVFEYYRESDITLGQYLEEHCVESSELCPSKICDRPMLMHYRSYVHGKGRVNVVIERFFCPMPGMSDTILMWSSCKVCKNATPVVAMSGETWKYSFGKYLELTFYHSELLCRPDISREGLCHHDIHRDHVRYFGLKNLAIRFDHEPIELLEVIVPPMRLAIVPETKRKMKEADNDIVRASITRYYDSLEKRIKGFDFDLVNPSKVEEYKIRLQDMSRRVTTEKKGMLHQLQQVYAGTHQTDTLSLNIVRRTLQERVLSWDQEFGDMTRHFRLTNAQISKIFQLDRDFALARTPDSLDQRAAAAMANDLPLLDVELGNGGIVTDDLTGSVYLEKAEKFESDPTILPQLGTSPTKTDFASLMSSTALVINRATAKSPRTGPSRTDPGAVTRPRDMSEDSSYFPDSRNTRRLSMQMMSSSYARTQQQRQFQRPTMRHFDSIDSNMSDAEGVDVEALPSAPSLLMPKFAHHGGPPTGRTPAPPLSAVMPARAVAGGIGNNNGALTRRRSGSSQNPLAPGQAGGSKGRRVSEAGEETGGYMGTGGRGSMDRNVPPTNRPIKALKKHAIRPESLPAPMAVVGRGVMQKHSLGTGTGTSGRVSRKSSAEDLHTHLGRGSGSKEPMKRNIKFSGKQKVRPTARPRLPSKASIEVYTTVKEVMKDLSDEEFPVDDEQDDDGDDTHTVSLTRTDAFDESFGHEFLATINESGNGGYFGLNHPDDSIYPLLGHESNDMLIFPEITTMTSEPITISNAAAAPSPTNALSLGAAKVISASLMVGLNAATAVSTPGGSVKIAPQPMFTSNFVQGGIMTPAIGVERQLSDSADYPSSTERFALVRTLTNFWTDRGSASLLPLDYPLASTEHVLSDAPIVVREDEPSSIIAYTLSCPDYREELSAMQESHAKSEMKMEDIITESDDPNGDAASDWVNLSEDTSSVSGTTIEKTLLKETGSHIKYRFGDGTATFSCQIFFAEQFDALRKNCGCDESIISSLARCAKWDPSGGKSGSTFLKTKDDRLLMKQMSKLELDAFTRFAPAYFHYMSEAFFHDLPTSLAKIYGFYRISCKNPATNRSMRMDVLVMENLFYQRSVTKIFDLKGSMRNRRATGLQNEVLLDENMVELMYKSPIFIRPHSKELLRGSLHNDTLFLLKLKVMDYSLLVGIDEEKHELVVGIVDFIRQFTWDKRLESFVKEAGILGGRDALPTIVSPKQYRIRFKKAMDQYFLMVPDIWTPPRIMGGPMHHHAIQQQPQPQPQIQSQSQSQSQSQQQQQQQQQQKQQ